MRSFCKRSANDKLLDHVRIPHLCACRTRNDGLDETIPTSGKER